MFMRESYADTWLLIPPIVLTYAVKSAYYFYIGFLFYYKEAARTIFVATVSSSILNVILTFWAVPVWGAYGSILADGISMSLKVGLVVWMSLRYQDCGYRLSQFALPFMTITAVLGIGLLPCYLEPYRITLPQLLWKVALYAMLVVYVMSKHPGFILWTREKFQNMMHRDGMRSDCNGGRQLDVRMH